MKRQGLNVWRHLGVALGVAGWAWSMGSAAAAPAKAAPPKQAAKPAVVQELELVHPFEGDKEAALRSLVERFNANSKDARVVLAAKGAQTQPTPHMLILDGVEGEEFLAGKARYKPLHALMREAGLPLQNLKPSSVMTRTPVDAKGALLALPVGLSTPVLFVNKDALRSAGVDPEAPIKTWLELQETLGKLVDAGQRCPYTVAEPARVMVENVSAWHNAPVAAKEGKVSRLSFNGMLQIKHVAMMASWYRARYLHIFDRSQEAERRFASGECAVIAASSASGTDFRRQAAFDVGVLQLPYHDDFPGAPQNTLADGASMWVAAGKKPAEYKAVARFVAFWLQPENQRAWQREAGYLPLNRGGMLADKSDLPRGEAESVHVGVAQLSHKPATPVSSMSPGIWRARVRQILDEELAAVWADRKPAKEALDTAVLRAAAR